jgi:hypothetical protein
MTVPPLARCRGSKARTVPAMVTAKATTARVLVTTTATADPVVRQQTS